MDGQAFLHDPPATFANPSLMKPTMYPCPVYRTLARSGGSYLNRHNYIMSIDLNPGRHAVDHWVKRGVAIVCHVAN